MRWMAMSCGLIGALLLGLAIPPAGPAVAAPVAPQAETLNIEQVGHWPAQNVRDIAARGSQAYVANSYSSTPVEGFISTVDVSAPDAPVELIEKRLSAEYDEIFVAGAADDAYLYSAESALDGLGLQMRVHGKDSLEQVCVAPVAGDHSVMDIWAAGAYFFAALDSGLRVYQPVAVGSPPLFCAQLDGLAMAGGVTAVAHDAAYVYTGTAGGALRIIDLTDPERPADVGSGDFFTDTVHAVAVDADTLYLAQDDVVKIIDVSDRSFPREVGSFTLPRSVRQLAAGDGYLTALAADGVIVVDVANPEAPAVVGYYLDDSDGRFGDALALGDGLIFSGGPEGMNILRFAPDPTPGLILQPQGEGGLLNGVEIPYPCALPVSAVLHSRVTEAPDCPAIKKNDQLELPKTDFGAKVYPNCAQGFRDLIVWIFSGTDSGMVKGPGHTPSGLVLIIDLVLRSYCTVAPDRAGLGDAAEITDPFLGVELIEGALRFQVQDERLSLKLQTSVATAFVQGINDFGVAHLPDENWAYVACYAGSVTVEPSNAALGTVTLDAGRQVTVTTSALGPITEIRYPAFLPLVSTPGDALPDNWETLLDENFEGEFPGHWQVVDGQSGFGEYLWDARPCRAHSGTSAAWAVGGGADGGTLACGANYPNNAQSWMIVGPFDLRGATAAELQFQYWLNTPETVDKLFWGASTDGINFNGWEHSGDSGGWQATALDLADVPGAGDLTGQPGVWVGIAFISDVSLTAAEGAYVDDLLLRKYTGAATSARSSMHAPTGSTAAALELDR